jgi:hypothetical protein
MEKIKLDASHAFTVNYKQTQSSYKNLIIHILPKTAVILSWIFVRHIRLIFNAPRTDFGISFKSRVYKQHAHESND